MLNNVVLITSGQPAANPRSVKEATTLAEAGFNVSVIYTTISPWADEMDKKLMLLHPEIKWICATQYSSNNLYNKIIRLRRRLYELVYTNIKGSILFAEKSISLYAQELKEKASSSKADLFIAHNLAALPVAVRIAKKYKAKVAFDAEDFHRGEVEKDMFEYRRIKKIEDAYIPQLTYLTTASPLISEAYKKLYPIKNIYTVLNVFPLKYQQPFELLISEPLKLIWFSQIVGLNRGLQDLFIAIASIINFKIELTIVGVCKDEVRKELLSKMNNVLHKINFTDPLPEPELLSLCAAHHIGSAAEIHEPYNREICLTNKLFFYMLAGNALLASETKAQKKLLLENKNIGLSYISGNTENIKKNLEYWYHNPEILTAHRKAAYDAAASEFNWDKEKNKLIKIVCETCTDHIS
ncbi:hypothetical protein BH09BAC2_BH09BAC2_15780 [soil metagenome]